MSALRLLEGDCRDVLATLDAESVDACVTDPPYELAFMGKAWDASGVAYDPVVWRAVLRVLKPGAHLLAFGGTRTHHRMVCAIEDAGFEIRDEIQWLYGSGFPKSLDVSKAIDKAAGVEREVIGERKRAGGPAGMTADRGWNSGPMAHDDSTVGVTAPATEAARQWSGWGTALKPACEPICLARKPLVGTVAANVLEHGTGALNIDGCRIATSEIGQPRENQRREDRDNWRIAGGSNGSGATNSAGRWPANVILDPEAAAMLDEQSGITKAGTRPPGRGGKHGDTGWRMAYGGGEHGDSGGASRFYYIAKPDRSERHVGNQVENSHPTVKPVVLIRYLVRLVTPPGGIVLDPFGGSGTTAIACHEEGFRAVLIEKDPDHFRLMEERVKHATAQANLFSAA